MEDLSAEVVTLPLLAPADDGAVVPRQRRALLRQARQPCARAQLHALRQLQQRQVVVHRVPGDSQYYAGTLISRSRRVQLSSEVSPEKRVKENVPAPVVAGVEDGPGDSVLPLLSLVYHQVVLPQPHLHRHSNDNDNNI